MLDCATDDLRSSFDVDLDLVKDKTYLTHNLHPYPAKFIPQIPHRLIELYSRPGDTVLDPFCGSGTSLVEARLLGRSAIGVDLNPLSALVSRVKATPLDAEEIGALAALQEAVKTGLLNPEGLPSLTQRALPGFKNRDHWFTQQSLHELNFILDQVERTVFGRARDAGLVVFSSIVVKASNQDSETRWVARRKDLRPGQVLKAFLEKLSMAQERLTAFSQSISLDNTTMVQVSDARDLPLQPETVDYAVTSPPYLNSFDYYLYHKLRTFWLGIDHKPVQEREIGSRHRHCDLGQDKQVFIDEMQACVKSVACALRIGARFSAVVGDSIVSGNLVPMDEIYIDIAERAGLKLDDHFQFEQRKYTRAFSRGFKTPEKRSHILTFVRPD